MNRNRQEEALRAFAAMYSARTLKEGQQLVFGVEGMEDLLCYAVLSSEKNSQTLTVCMDRAALVSYAMLVRSKSSGADPLRIAGQMLDLNCLQCHVGQFSEQPLQSYMKQFDYMKDQPQGDVVLRKWQSGMLPDSNLSSSDMRCLLAALETALAYFGDGHTVEEASENLRENGSIVTAKWLLSADFDGLDDEMLEWSKISLEEYADVGYPSPALEDELQIQRIKRKKTSGATLLCSLRRLPIPISEDPVRTPIMLAMIDDQNGVVGTDIVEDYGRDCLDLASSFMSYMDQFGRPAKVVVDNERTYGLVSAIAQQVGVDVGKAQTLSQIDELTHAYLNMVCGSNAQSAESSPEPAPTAHSGNGICMVCGKELPVQDMQAHIAECIESIAVPDGEENMLLRIVGRDDPEYWMYIALKKDAQLAQLDKFLRDVWVDCCDHLSVFTAGGKEYYSSHAREMEGHSMKLRLFEKNPDCTQLLYEYDFGTPTRLQIDVIGSFKAEKRHKKAIQLARNIQPQYSCIVCGAKAAYVSSRMDESIADSAYCEACGFDNEEIKSTLLPIVNSPRSGMCGYGAWMMDDDLFGEEE